MATLSGDMHAGFNSDLPIGSATFRQPGNAAAHPKASRTMLRHESIGLAQSRRKMS